MQNKKIIIPLALLPLVISFFVFSPKPAQASFLDDVVDKVQDIFTPDAKKEFTIDSEITLAPGGDVDKDGQIDAGDIIRFTYSLKNATDKDFTFATLKTNIDRKQINFIHNVTGTANISDDAKTITIPNYRIGSKQVSIITFDARVNYYTNKDVSIVTALEFVDKDRKIVIKSDEKKVNVRKIVKEKVPGMTKREVKE